MTGFIMFCERIFGEAANMVIGSILMVLSLIVIIGIPIQQISRSQYIENYKVPKQEIRILLMVFGAIFVFGLFLALI